MFMFDEFVRSNYRDWQMQGVFTLSLTLFAYFLLFEPSSIIEQQNFWLRGIIHISIITLVVGYLYAATTTMYICVLMPLAALRAMIRLVKIPIIVPVVTRLVERLGFINICQSFSRKRTQPAKHYSLASLFSLKHGAYALHPLTQRLLFYS